MLSVNIRVNIVRASPTFLMRRFWITSAQSLSMGEVATACFCFLAGGPGRPLFGDATKDQPFGGHEQILGAVRDAGEARPLHIGWKGLMPFVKVTAFGVDFGCSCLGELAMVGYLLKPRLSPIWGVAAELG